MKHFSHLSKSRFLSDLQCPKRLYLQVRQPELAAQGDAAAELVLAQGREVGLLATRAFPGGVRVEEDHRHFPEAEARTWALMDDPQVPAIFEAAFQHEDVVVRVDILERCARGAWRLIEVKSTTVAKDYHEPDVGIQAYVLRGCGLRLSDTCLMHLDRSYVFPGGEHDPRQLFQIESLAERASAMRRKIPGQLCALKEMLASDYVPEIEPGPQCEYPVACEFYDICHSPRDADWVGNLPRIGHKAEELVAQGIESIHDIPGDFPLTAAQQRACACVKSNTAFYAPGLRAELAALAYPLYFMDFETFAPAVPRFPGMRPYDAIPFQWSVHVSRKPGGNLEHYEFLGDSGEDPREEFLVRLLDVLGNTGHIVVYNQGFESGRLRELAAWFPAYANRVEAVQARLWDLLALIRRHVYHPGFCGSFSLKAVLPALFRDMTYAGMEVADGSQAGVAYEKLAHVNLPQAEREALRRSLLAYCRQDSLAMDTLLHHLEERCPK